MACAMSECFADDEKALHKEVVHGEHRELGEGVELPFLLSRLPVFGPTE